MSGFGNFGRPIYGWQSSTALSTGVVPVPGEAMLLTESGDQLLLTEGGDPILLSEAE